MNDLKLLMKLKGIAYHDVAQVLRVHPQTIQNWMQHYNADHHEKIMNAINKLSGGEKDEQNNKERFDRA